MTQAAPRQTQTDEPRDRVLEQRDQLRDQVANIWRRSVGPQVLTEFTPAMTAARFILAVGFPVAFLWFLPSSNRLQEIALVAGGVVVAQVVFSLLVGLMSRRVRVLGYPEYRKRWLDLGGLPDR